MPLRSQTTGNIPATTRGAALMGVPAYDGRFGFRHSV